MIGINIDDIYDKKLEEKISKLPSKENRVARVVVDNPVDIKQVKKVCSLLKRNGIDPLVQIQDSYGEKDLTDKALYEKAALLFKELDSWSCNFWEIGNEVTGEWCSSNIAERVSAINKMVPVGHKTLLTLFWDDRWGYIDWYKKNPVDVTYIGISFYPHSNAENPVRSIQEGIESLCIDYPRSKVIISEYGFEEWQGNLTWRQKDKIKKTIESIGSQYTKNYEGGGFYWDGQKEGF